MSQILNKFLERNRQRTVAVTCIGDAMIDEYYQVSVNRISPEFPMPIMHSETDEPVRRPGGVANVSHQLKNFNVKNKLICFNDDKLEGLIDFVKFSFIQNAKLPIKRRFLDHGIQVKRHDIEQSLCGYEPFLVDAFMCAASAHMLTTEKPDVAILSDYDKGFFSSSTYNPMQWCKNVKTIVDPKRGPIHKWQGCTIFKPNAAEAKALSGRDDWRYQAEYFKKTLKCDAVVITHSGDRVVGIDQDDSCFQYQPDRKVKAQSSVGAGDCFSAFLALAIGHGFDVQESVEIAWNAGAAYVQKGLNQPLVPSDLCLDGLIHPEDLKARDFKLAFTNGCFDVLHSGHLATIALARSKADKLVVALNSDDSIKRIKGESRPVKTLSERKAVMAALKNVDFVVDFSEDTPLDLLKTIQPDVLVKGADYQLDEVVGRDLVKEVHLVPLVEGISTSQILARYDLQQQ